MSNRAVKSNRIFSNSISQRNSESEESLHLNSNGNVNDCNLLLDKRKNAETSIFDDSSIATVSTKLTDESALRVADKHANFKQHIKSE